MSGARRAPGDVSQLSLFGGAAQPSLPARAVEPRLDAAWCELGERLPPWIRLGSSSWTFPGWAGLIYDGEPSNEALNQSGLAAYAQHPLLRTVGIDRSYYGPLRDVDLDGYALQLRAAEQRLGDARGRLAPFRAISKVWEEITTAVFPHHPRYGARAGAANPNFLDASCFLSEVLPPYRGSFSEFVGPFVFELTPMPRGALDPRGLARKVDAFLRHLPSGFRWAFELRNAELLTATWFEVLASHGAAHVFNYWTAMPDVRMQLAQPRALATDFVVARLMLPPYARYEDKKDLFAPFNKLVEPQGEMRDDVLALLRRAKQHGAKDAYVLVGNKAEGSSPFTVAALAERIVREL